MKSKSYPAPKSAQTIAAADFDSDGRADIIVGGTAQTAILLGAGDGTLGAAKSFAVPSSSPMKLAVADFNGDGLADFAIGSILTFNTSH